MTTDADETPADDVKAAPRRRRWFKRRTVTPEAEEVAAEEPAPAPKMPMGKAARTAKSEPEQAEDVVEEPTTDGEQPETDEVTPQEVRFVPHRPAGRRLTVAVLIAAVLFVGAAGFAAATLQPYLAERAEVDTKLDVALTAASAISTLWTYTPENMEQLPERSAGFLGGDFAFEYRKYIDAIVASNKQAQVTNTTQVLGAAVETLTPTEASAIVYTNSVATSPLTKNIPSLRYLSYRLTMERRDAKWLITRMSTITSLDLTPQL
ncbi:mammalian cell entry protein [Mycolicibacterium flavescens]|uniref:Mammalian cell entry protein n=1 Tax=Mycolicibacterium flavescens TaxID=1776 RepID=A0A1E3RFH2_MYCFV|nr:mammalian cell entry protein [Mycolicibacterium flavescens]